MRLKVLVETADYTSAVIADSLTISQDVTDRVSTASLTFKTRGGEGYYYDEALYDSDAVYGVDVQELYKISIENLTGAIQFAGHISRVSYHRESSTLTLVTVDCQDWTALLDRIVVPEAVFIGQSDRTIIQGLMAAYAPEISATNINIAQLVPNIGSFVVKEKTLRQVLEEIAELTGGEWRVDYEKNLIYFLPQTYPAPFGLSSSPNTQIASSGGTWDDATQTWSGLPITSTWEDAQGLSTGAYHPVWNNVTQTWDQVQGSWDDPVDPGGGTGLPTYGISRVTGYVRDFIKPINQCTVLGGFLAGVVEINITYEDPISVAQYGVYPTTIIDREIALASDAYLRAKALVDQYAYPQESLSLTTHTDGLAVGQFIRIFHAPYQINKGYIIRSLRLRQKSRTLTEYELDLGARQPDIVRLLRQLEARNRRSTQVVTGIPVPGSVGNGSIVVGGLSADVINTINAGSIIGTISANQIGSINATAILGQITAEKIAAVNSVSIQGVISADQIGSINAVTIQGVIISSQVADNLIDSLSKISASIRDIPEGSAEPALPNPNFPEGSFFRNTVTNQFSKSLGGEWEPVSETEAVTGRMAFYSLGSIRAGSIIGLIAAAQIGTITAGQITGLIQADQINEVNASAIVGAINSAQIGSVNASAIQGSIASALITSVNAAVLTGTISADRIVVVNASSITNGLIQASQIQTVNAGSITGTLSAAQIGSINATQITGTLTAAQIGTINASSISGTLTATQIGSINAATITVGLVQDGQIGSVGAGKISAGTITASISITAPTINGGALNGTSLSISVAQGTANINPVSFDPTYGSLGYRVSDPSGTFSWQVGRGFATYTSGGQSVASLNRTIPFTDVGEMVIYNAGTIVILADGITGRVRANGFQAGGFLGLTTSLQYLKSPSGSGTLIFTGGILTNSS